MTPRQRLLALLLAMGLVSGIFAFILALQIGADPEQTVLLAFVFVAGVMLAMRLRNELQARVPPPDPAERRRRLRALLGAAAGLVVSLPVGYMLATFVGMRDHLAAALGLSAGLVVGIPLMLLGFYRQAGR